MELWLLRSFVLRLPAQSDMQLSESVTEQVMLAMLVGWSYDYFAHLCCDFLHNLTCSCDHVAKGVNRQCNRATKVKVCSATSRFQRARLLQAVLHLFVL